MNFFQVIFHYSALRLFCFEKSTLESQRNFLQCNPNSKIFLTSTFYCSQYGSTYYLISLVIFDVLIFESALKKTNR